MSQLYKPSDALGDIYTARTLDFIVEGQKINLRPAVKDQRRVAIILVDEQVDFCHPTGTLFVKGAQEDLGRLLGNFFYPNVEEITTVIASLDTHNPYQIFYPTWWQYEDDGSHPAPNTRVVLNQGQAYDPDNNRFMRPVMEAIWTLTQYLPKLEAEAKKQLMIWPYHTMQGTAGHNLMPALSEAIAFHSGARLNQPVFIVKGTVPQTENYGILAPEVSYSKNPNGVLNTAMLQMISSHDLVYVAGQAKSHCVLETMKQLVKFGDKSLLRKLRFLTDTTSSVTHPAIDFDAIANAELANMQQLGVQLVKSTDPIA